MDESRWDCLECGVSFMVPLHKGRHPALMVLDALLTGLPVYLGGHTYEVGYDPRFGFPIVGIRATQLTEKEHLAGEEGTEYIFDSQMTLSNFLQLCVDLPHTRVTEIGANLALNKMKQEEASKRTIAYERSKRYAK
jgi:hypothetical protein